MSTPKFFLLDGSDTTTQLNLVTSVRDQILKGEVSADTVDMQIRINGGSFFSDPDLLTFGDGDFTVPNLNVHPEGFRFRRGVNTIELRSISVTGQVSGIATASIEVVRQSDLDLVSPPPSGLRVRRRRESVELVWSESDLDTVLGYNIYASVDSGGGRQGYVKINSQLITNVAFQEESVRPVTDDITFYQGEGGQLRVLLVEEDFNDQPIKTVGEFVMDTGLQANSELKTTVQLEEVLTSSFHHFVHDRSHTPEDGTINNEFFADVPPNEPLYYVITTVAHDEQTGEQIESMYSSELVGVPFTITTDLQEIPAKTQTEITREYITSLIRGSNNEISAIPGSVVRDVFIEPFASEAERLHFIANFIRRSQSFSTLLEIDDLRGTGTSDLVSENPYKRALKAALGFEADADLQALIDDSFEKLATNYQKVRGGAEFAVGTATFYTSREPTEDMVVETGTLVVSDGGEDDPTATFQTTSRVVIPFDFRDSYFNVQQRRWEIQANIRAVNPGENGNIAAGQISTILGGTVGFQVENLSATRFGRDRESNSRLAERSMLALSSVDAGTGGGYLATALEQQGVFRAKVIKAGDLHMMRDYDDVRNKHIGGKVDVWLQGSEQIQVTDTFALRFRIIQNATFTLNSSPADLIFRVVDPRVTPESPISEILGATSQQIAQGFSFRNLTTGETFDLTGYEILDYNLIQLDSSIAQPSVGSNDLISGDFRFQETSDYVFSRQPVQAIESVRSLNTGNVLEEETNYRLFRVEDPLLEGRSTKAQDFLQIQQDSGFTVGELFVVNDERHVLVGEIPEPLDNLGTNPVTVRVFSLDRLTEYNGPQTANPDFLLEEGDETTPLRMIRVPTGNIGNGEEVSVDYEHDENFEVEYTINNLLQRVQESIDTHRHITADVVVKDAISNRVDLEVTIVLRPGSSRAQVDSEIRTAISQLLNGKAVGEPVYQSDIVQVIENTRGVVFVVVPFAKMALTDGALIVRESLNNDATLVEQRGSHRVYALTDRLTHPTTDSGGPDQEHKGVFQDTRMLQMVDSYESLFLESGRVLLVGSEGRSIQGFSDNGTLTSQGYDTVLERQQRRLELTANRVFVVLDEQDTPTNYTYNATYIVTGDSGAKSIIPSPISYLELGDLTITYGDS